MALLVNYKQLKTITSLIWQDFNRVGCFIRAGNLAFVTLLSLVPLLTVSFTILSAFPTFRTLGIKLQQLIFDNLVAIPTETVREYLQTFINQTSQLSVIGMIFLMATAVLLVFSMEQTFNAIWHVKRNRRGVTAFLLYWAVITLIPIVIAAIVWCANYFIAQINSINVNLSFIDKSITLLAPYVATLLAFMVLFVTLPNCQVRYKNALISAVIATLVFEVGRKIFALFIARFATYKIIYGAFAIIPIFLVWLYISWLIILVGVTINYVLEEMKNEKLKMKG